MQSQVLWALVLLGVSGIDGFHAHRVLHTRRHVVPSMVAVGPAAAPSSAVDPLPIVRPQLSGLEGKALAPDFLDNVPSKAAVRAVVPSHCYTRQTWRSLAYLAQSVITTALTASLGLLIPLKLAALPLWLLYAAVTGTTAMGMWVLAHECGHGAFSDNRLLQDAVGFVLHSLLLVPYFSWQRSHAVHHARTNHIYEGETHVPTVVDGRDGHETPGGAEMMNIAKNMGERRHGFYQLFGHLTVRHAASLPLSSLPPCLVPPIYPFLLRFAPPVEGQRHSGRVSRSQIGWPSYILAGLTGGSKYGTSNHFWPFRPLNSASAQRHMWPNKWPTKVLQSSAGVAAVLVGLAMWARRAGAATVWALYGGPYLVVNMWLIVYTWLQHTDVDVPHLGASEFTYMRGAFHTIDRPYPPLIDRLHHRIGSTHVAHHIDCTIPHYHAREATDAIAKAFPKVYLHEPTPVHIALWRVACHCIAVKRRSADDQRYVFVPLHSWRSSPK